MMCTCSKIVVLCMTCSTVKTFDEGLATLAPPNASHLCPKRVNKRVGKKASLPVEDLKNYGPVSGLSFISKLVELVVSKQLVDHIHRHG